MLNDSFPVENINAGDVAKAAKEGDTVAREALKWHYLIFMRAAKFCRLGCFQCLKHVKIKFLEQFQSIRKETNKQKKNFY